MKLEEAKAQKEPYGRKHREKRRKRILKKFHGKNMAVKESRLRKRLKSEKYKDHPEYLLDET